jgi:DNA-binding response OmpR family regulator
MKILVAEDNPVFQAVLESLLSKWGYEVVLVSRGDKAWEVLQSEDGPQLAILDWFMPGFDGPTVCRKVRASKIPNYIYILLLTAKDRSGNVVTGLEAGADDYLTKPFNAEELRVRLKAAERILNAFNTGHSQTSLCRSSGD